jgi:FtsP/CotA-like multicopper oxidase with cupredoxin domain
METQRASRDAWNDTVLISSGQSVPIKTWQGMTGKRMFHCHILEHEDNCMWPSSMQPF